MDSSDLVIVIGSFAAMLAGFFAILRYTLKQGSDDRCNDRKERQNLTEAIKNMAQSTDKVAVATVKGNDEARQRNGHLGEQNIKLAEMLTAQTSQLSSINKTLTSSAVVLAQDTAVALHGTQTVADLLKTTGQTLAENTEIAHQGTEDVKQDLKDSRLQQVTNWTQ